MINSLGPVWSMAFSMLASNFLVILACLGAIAVILMRWGTAPKASKWALAGFALALVMSLVMPVVQAMIQHSIMNSQQSSKSVGSTMMLVSMSYGMMRGAVFVLLLVAIYSDRVPTTQRD